MTDTTATEPAESAAEPTPIEHKQFVSVTTVLNVIPKTDVLIPWAAGKVADRVIRDIEQSVEWARDVLLDLRQEAGLGADDRTPMRMRDKAEAEAWRRLSIAQAVLKDRRAARRELVDSRWNPEVDEDGREYAFTATGLGTTIHDMFDRWLITGQRPINPHPELAPFLDRLDEWLDEWQPEVILAEATLVNPAVGYAGRGDAVLRFHVPELGRKATMITDLKSRRKGSRTVRGQEVDSTPYVEGGYQTVAYGHATHVVSWADAPKLAGEARGSGRYYYVDPAEWRAAWEMPEVDCAGILLVTPDRCTLHRVAWEPGKDEWAWDAFRFYVGSSRALHSRRHDGLLGPAMAPPYRPDHRTHGDTDLEARLRDSIPADSPTSTEGTVIAFPDQTV